MNEVVICEPVRTPVGRFGGSLKDHSAATLAAVTIRGLLGRTGLPTDVVDDVILGQCYPNGEAPAIGRVAALDAGLPVDVPGVQVDRRCGSALMAIIYATMQVQTGAADLVLAGGTESMSQTEFYSTRARWGVEDERLIFHDRLARARLTAGGENWPVPGGMLETAENLREAFAIPRREQDEWALRSHQHAVNAQKNGWFSDEIIPVEVMRKGHTEKLVDTDEHPRADSSMESLERLRPIRLSLDPEATVTAGNSSGQNDAAAICIVTSRKKADHLGLRAMARLVSWAVAGVPPRTMGIGPVPATEVALARAGLTLTDMDLIELNEAFAVQVIACTRSWGFGVDDKNRLNVNGSGISLGHPVGATGGRILASLLRELDRRGARYGLETMCIGGGQGISAVFELLPP